MIDLWQRDFPLVARPFAEMAAKLDLTRPTLSRAWRRFRQRARCRASALSFGRTRSGHRRSPRSAAPTGMLEEIASAVIAEPGVNHAYEREHAFNLWFVVDGARCQWQSPPPSRASKRAQTRRRWCSPAAAGLPHRSRLQPLRRRAEPRPRPAHPARPCRSMPLLTAACLARSKTGSILVPSPFQQEAPGAAGARPRFSCVCPS